MQGVVELKATRMHGIRTSAGLGNGDNSCLAVVLRGFDQPNDTHRRASGEQDLCSACGGHGARGLDCGRVWGCVWPRWMCGCVGQLV